MRIIKRGSRPREHGKMACITCFFDWAANPWLAHNHEIFRQHWEQSGIPLYTVALHRKSDRLQLADHQNLMRVQVRDPLFHKESALNYAVKNLPADYQVILYVDADMLIQDYSALDQIPKLLAGNTRAVQAIGTVHYRGHDNRLTETRTAYNPAIRLGFYGAAWAYRREFFDVHGGFYTSYPLGGLDTCALIAAYNDAHNPRRRSFWKILPPHISRDAKAWCEVKGKYFGGQVQVLNVEADHLWHGDLSNRKYVDRHRILRNVPPSCFKKDRNGFVEFEQLPVRARQQIQSYWKDRKPDQKP